MWKEDINWGDSLDGLRMACSTEQEIFAKGEKIVVRIVLQNIGRDVSLSFTETTPFENYQISIVGPDERPVELTKEGSEMKAYVESGEHFRRTLVTLRPKETREVLYPLSEWFDLNVAGQYSVEVSRPDWGETGLSSPSIQFTLK